MNVHKMNVGYLDANIEGERLMRALAAHLDGLFKRADISPARAAKWLGLPNTTCNVGHR